jgi:O-antigen ligase
VTALRTRAPVGAASAPDQEPARRADLWPVIACTLFMPVAYFLGVSALMWLAPIGAIALLLQRRRSIRMPWSALPLAALILWIPVTMVSVHGTGSAAVFVYRWLLWVATLAGMLWLCNTSERRVPTGRVVDLLAALWIVLVAFGYLALLFPTVDVASPFARVLPGALSSNEFVGDLTVIRFAELQQFVGGAVPRPAAPMIATNGWGSTLALLTPFFVLSWLLAVDRRRRRVGWLLAAIAIPPFAVSTNRGAWISLAVGLIYVAGRTALRGNVRPLGAIAACGVIAVAVVAVTPLDSVVQARLNGADASNQTRASLYELAWEKTQQSPFVGYGEPVANPPDPPIGTHGLVWYAMVAHGIPGFVLLAVALVALLVGSFRARTARALWIHSVVLICIVQAPFYGLLPQIVLVGLAAGLCWREDHAAVMAGG